MTRSPSPDWNPEQYERFREANVAPQRNMAGWVQEHRAGTESAKAAAVSDGPAGQSEGEPTGQ